MAFVYVIVSWPVADPADAESPRRSRCHQPLRLAASDGSNDLILLDIGVERRAIQHMLAVHLLRDHAAMLTSLTQNALGLLDLLARRLGIGGFPLDYLVSAPIRDKNTSHRLLRIHGDDRPDTASASTPHALPSRSQLMAARHTMSSRITTASRLNLPLASVSPLLRGEGLGGEVHPLLHTDAAVHRNRLPRNIARFRRA